MPIDEFFDSNDGFDELILSAEANIPSTTVTSSTTTTSSTTARTETVLSDDLAAAFNDDDDDFFADVQWGSGNHKSKEQNKQSTSNPVTTNTAASSRNRTDMDDSFGKWLNDDNNDDDDFSWGSSAKKARLSTVGTATKRATTQNTFAASTSSNRDRLDMDDSFGDWFSNNDNNTNDGDYVWGTAAKNARLSEIGSTANRSRTQESWGSSSRISSEETNVNVKCTGCHQPAKE